VSQKRIIFVCVMTLSLIIGALSIHSIAAQSQLPVSVVSPSSAQLAPVTTSLQMQFDRTSQMWKSVQQQFLGGHYGIRLSSPGTVVWFIPAGTPEGNRLLHSSLTLRNAIAFNASTGVLTAQPDPLVPGQSYTVTLAIKDDLSGLLNQDLGLGHMDHPLDPSASFGWNFHTASAISTSAKTDTITTSGTTVPVLLSHAGTLQTTATGSGTVATVAYAGNPVSTSNSFTSLASYFDLSTGLGSSFSNLSSTVCGLPSGASLAWWTGSAWQRVTPQQWRQGCVTMSLSNNSNPTLNQLSGTPFVAVPAPVVTALSPSSGSATGGDAIELHGTGFTGTSSVSFGGAAVPTTDFTVVNDTLIEIWKTPEGDGTPDVTTTTTGGISASTVADQFHYVIGDQTIQRLAIPSYFSPGPLWSQMESSAPTVGIAVINPASGPGSSFNQDYATQVQQSQTAGLTVLGYVHTSYGSRSSADLQAEVDAYYNWYHVDGIFFDEASTDCSLEPTYAALSSYVKAKGGVSITVLNPGTTTNECYLSAADIVVTFEGDYSAYTGSNYNQPAWVENYPAARFWHLVYNASGAQEVSAVDLSKQRHAGWIYATSDVLPNPWDSLPSGSDWSSELLAAHSQIPVVTSVQPSSGPASQSVTVSGTGLGNASQVCFGASCVSSGIVVNGDGTQLTVAAPSGVNGASVDLTVTTPGGTSATSSSDQFRFRDVAPTNLLVNGGFAQGTSTWNLTCNTWGFSGGGTASGCGSFATTSRDGLTLDSTNTPYNAPYIGAEQIVPASANAVLSGTVTVNQLTACSTDASVSVSVTLLDASQQPLVATDPFGGTIILGHHPYTSGCTPFVYPNSNTLVYQDMPNWSADSGPQHFVLPIGSLVAGQLSGIDAAQVAYLKIRLQVYADQSRPSVTFSDLQLHNSMVVNVRDLGALGDGTTNDTAAFQQALSQLNVAGGGILRVPPATYVVDPAALVIRDNVVIDASGATLKPSETGFQLLELEGSNIAVEGLALDGTNLVVRGLSVDAGSGNVLLSHVSVQNLAQPTDSNDPVYDGMPVGMKIYGNIDGIQIDTASVHNVFADHPECAAGCTRVARGILVSPDSGETMAQHVVVEYSSFAEVGPKDDGDCIVAQDSNDTANLTIQNNNFDRCYKRAIKVQVPGVVVANNTITNSFMGDNFTDPNYGYAQSQFPFDMYAAISVYADNVTVSDNTISGSGSFYNGIEIGAGPTLSNVTVTDNHVQMGSSYSITDPSLVGASLIREMSPVTGLTITGNSLNHAWTGIAYVVGSDTSGIDGNTITDVTYAMLATQPV